MLLLARKWFLDEQLKNKGFIMAGKAKSIYLTVTTLGHKEVFHRMFFNAKDLNAYIKTDEFQEKYPTTEFKIIKETY
jgi:hypothetical protein